MINWNDIKQFDVTNLTKIDVSRFDVRYMDLPKFEMPNVDQFEMPEAGIADVERFTGLARDAAYAGVGAAVVTVQKLDEQRRELADQAATQVRKIVDAIT